MTNRKHAEAYRYSLDHRPLSFQDDVHGFSGGPSSFSNPQSYIRNSRTEPPEYRSRRSDYISRPSYSSTDYIDPHDKSRQKDESTRSYGFRTDYMSLHPEPKDGQLVALNCAAASTSTYVNATEEAQGALHSPAQSNSFCQPILSTIPVVERRATAPSSFSSPHEDDHTERRRSKHTTVRNKYRRVRCHDSVQCNEEYDRSMHDSRRSHVRSSRYRSDRHDSIDYGSDYERYEAPPARQLKSKEDDDYGSDYQPYSSSRRIPYDMEQSDDGSDIVPSRQIHPPTRRLAHARPASPYRGGFSQSSGDGSSSLISSLDGNDESSSTNTFCSPLPTNSRKDYRRTMEDYGSDVEVMADDDGSSDDGVSLPGSDFVVDGGAESDSYSESEDDYYVR